MKQALPKRFLRLLEGVRPKRPRTVIRHILEHGSVTTEELKSIYGYNHPPRAIRDVREHGIPLTMFRVTGSDGRRIAAYRFGDPSSVRSALRSGRTVRTANLRRELIEKYGARCHLYRQPFPERELQIDHRIPFEIAGDSGEVEEDAGAYMLGCPSANRAKSWSCEHCPNWRKKEVDLCRTCYWAYPENYEHVATRPARRLDLTWTGEETSEYDDLRAEAGGRENLSEHVKRVLRSHLRGRPG